MSDRVLLSASPANIRDCVALAGPRGLGIELMTFAFPDVLDGDWRSVVREYQTLLAPISLRTMHGPFFDMAPGSMDRRVNELVMSRYRQALDIAAELWVTTVVYHANFITSLRTEAYRTSWTKRNIEFFSELAPHAAERGVTIAIENMWEYEPAIIGDVIRGVNHPSVRACLDVGHAHLFGEAPYAEWLRVLGPLLAHIHMNNNDGKVDVHCALDDGVLDYEAIIPGLRDLPMLPTMTLEMDRVEDMAASLKYFRLG
ncbi:MAG: sugar phosphate isomerase/epimerase [Anaerolineae bacterium]|nr:sugar phosphate isomerase/epimerase [Anaerolineae bacterium]